MNDLANTVSENAVELARLSVLARSLSVSQLTTPMEAGWTVSAVLAHLAFWDMRATTLLNQWAEEDIGPSPIDTDLINEVTRHLCLEIPPQDAVELCIRAAQRIDQIISELTIGQAAEIIEKGSTVHLNRAEHRRLHLAEIQTALGII